MSAVLPDVIAAGSLELRRWDESHLDAVLDVISSSFAELHAWMPWAREIPTRDAQLGFLRIARSTFDAGTEYGYAMFEPSGALVGSCGLHSFVPGVCQIGYFVRTDRTGRGYATLAARALTSVAFEYVPGLERVEIRCDVANVASAAVPRKLGFALVGEVDRPIEAPSHTGRGYVFAMSRVSR